MPSMGLIQFSKYNTTDTYLSKNMQHSYFIMYQYASSIIDAIHIITNNNISYEYETL